MFLYLEEISFLVVVLTAAAAAAAAGSRDEAEHQGNGRVISEMER